VQALPSLHVVPSAALPSAGQLAALPVQFSATSQAPLIGRQTVDEGLNGLTGQVVDVPVQVASRSQTSVAARHCVPACPAGCWQTADEPLQVSVVQTLPSSGQDVPLALKPFAGQVVDEPVQVAARSQTSAAARHWVPA
jgi:hypothetical protein